MSRVLHVVVGPQGHGVTRHALGLLAEPALAHHAVAHVDDAADLTELPAADLTHLHLTDHLLAPTAGACADVVDALADRRVVSLSLHDLPQPADGPGRYERRRAAYARMAARAALVVLASEHERRLLETAVDAEGRRMPPVVVVPLPLTSPPERFEVATELPRELAVFGYLYPGKGHEDAVAAAPGGGRVVALGEVSAGHEEWAEDVVRQAERQGVTVAVTGHVPESEVGARLRAAGVPVAPHRHVSASGSIGSWLAAGRRPLVPAGAYVDEVEARCPGALLRYGPGTDLPDLKAAAAAAFADPGLTWLAPGTHLFPDSADCATSLAAALDERVRGVR